MSRPLFTVSFTLESDGRVTVHDGIGPTLTGEAGATFRRAGDALHRLADIFDASTKTTAETVDKLRAWSVRALGGGEA